VLLPGAGVMSGQQANDYANMLESASRDSTFFASRNFHTMIVRDARQADELFHRMCLSKPRPS
jgi:hypothetical protein